MTYLIIEMVSLLLAAMLIGLIIGWLIERWLRYQEIEALRQALRNTRLSYEQNERLLRHRVAELTHVAQSFKAQLLDAGIQPALPMPEVKDTGTAQEQQEHAAPTARTANDADAERTAQADKTKDEAKTVDVQEEKADRPAEQAASQATETAESKSEETESATAAENQPREEAAEQTRRQAAEAKQTAGERPAQRQAAASPSPETPTDAEWPYPVQEVEGIGPVYSKRLKEKGIVTTAELIEKTSSEEAKEEIARHVKVSKTVLQRWVNMCRLMTIPGIRGQHAKLLELADIHNAADLSKQSARTLTRRLRIVNELHHIAAEPPKETEVRKWVQFAKTQR